MTGNYTPAQSRWVVSIGTTVIFLGLFVGVMIVFYQQADLYDTPHDSLFNATSTNRMVVFNIAVEDVDIGKTVTLTLSPVPSQFTRSIQGSTPDTAGLKFTLAVNGDSITYSNGSLLSSATFTPRLSGNTALYPLDSYSGGVNVQVYEGDSFSTSSLDIAVRASDQPVPGYSFSWSQSSANRGIHLLKLSVYRSGLGKVYPIFLLVAFWIIAAGMTAVTFGLTLWRYRSIDGDYLSLTGYANVAVYIIQ